jgi:hypothetical protein
MLRAAAALYLAACAGNGAASAEPPEPVFPTAERFEAITLAGDQYLLPGTLELPAARAPVACAVFFAGSGPTDRDWRSRLGGGPPTGELLAAALRDRGVGSFRFDKVGSAANRSAIARLSLDHYRDEGELAFEFVEDLPECARVYLLGNSEGAIHALRTAAEKASDPMLGGVIAIDPPARPLIDELLDQIWAAELRRGADQGELAQLLSDFRYFAGRGEEPHDGGIPALARLWRTLNHPANSRVARQLLFADPLRAAAGFGGSVLVVSSAGQAEASARVLAALGPAASGAFRRREIIGETDTSFVTGDAIAPGVTDAIAAFIAATNR